MSTPVATYTNPIPAPAESPTSQDTRSQPGPPTAGSSQASTSQPMSAKDTVEPRQAGLSIESKHAPL